MVKEDLQKGITAAKRGQRGEARAAFRAILTEDPTNEAALLWLAYLTDDPRASLAYIARALEAHPQSPRAHAALRWARRRLAEQAAPPDAASSPAISSRAARLAAAGPPPHPSGPAQGPSAGGYLASGYSLSS